jgi:hypothetical protein
MGKGTAFLSAVSRTEKKRQAFVILKASALQTYKIKRAVKFDALMAV